MAAQKTVGKILAAAAVRLFGRGVAVPVAVA
jgi:hypothetical protein